ncbi:acyl-CoA dehydrogenase family protein [Paraherbaspirillum soli]|uniref:acyl-CoA dehydrogenase family protein n=1 Tax=Paraherbaspirillum soli TaxID=631222 RepID=UPI00366C4651
MSDWLAGPAGSDIDAITRDADPKVVGRKLTRLLGQADWLRFVVPRAGDSGQPKLDVRSMCLLREAFASYHDLLDFSFSIQGLGCAAAGLYGDVARFNQFLAASASGEMLGSFAISEPEVGSNLAAAALEARLVDGRYVLNGVKTWVSYGNIADVHCVLVRTGEGPGAMGLSLLLVPADTPGLTIAQDIALIAPRAFATLNFSNCEVAADQLVGVPGMGFKYALQILDIYRVTVAAAAIGFCRKALRVAGQWAKSRRIGDEFLFDMQMTKSKLADMAVYLDATSLLVARAAWELDTRQGKDISQRDLSRHISIAKLFGTDGAQQVVDDAVQIMGAYGVVKDAEVENLYRQIRLLRIYEGTSEIQRLIIANNLNFKS